MMDICNRMIRQKKIAELMSAIFQSVTGGCLHHSGHRLSGDLMIARGTGKQLSIRFGGTMTSPASEIQADLTGSKASIVVELADHTWIDRHHMRTHIPGVSLWIGRAGLDQARHVAVDAGNAARGMSWVILKLDFLEMTVLAFKPGGL